MLRMILTVWTDSTNALTRQNWERFCNNWKLIRGISNRRLQSCGKEGLLPFPSSYLLSRFRSTLCHKGTSLNQRTDNFGAHLLVRSKHGAHSWSRPVFRPAALPHLYRLWLVWHTRRMYTPTPTDTRKCLARR